MVIMCSRDARIDFHYYVFPRQNIGKTSSSGMLDVVFPKGIACANLRLPDQWRNGRWARSELGCSVQVPTPASQHVGGTHLLTQHKFEEGENASERCSCCDTLPKRLICTGRNLFVLRSKIYNWSIHVLTSYSHYHENLRNTMMSNNML